MKLKDFISKFSHNNAMWVENKKRHLLVSRYNENEEWVARTLMDWELQHTTLANCKVIRICNVVRPQEPQAMTIVVDTDLDILEFVPELVTMENSPVWLYERVHQVSTNVYGQCLEAAE